MQAEVALLVDSETPLETLRQVALEVARKCPYALQEKAPEVKLRGLSRDDMKAEISFWTLGIHYEEAVYFLYEELHHSLEAAGVKLAKERRKESV